MNANIKKILALIKGQSTYEYFNEYSELQWKAAEVLRQYQLTLIRNLLQHACNSVPHYTRVFAKLKIMPDDIRSYSDYAALPSLTKQMIKDNPEDFISSAFARSSLKKNNSGGSTGTPLTFFHDHKIYEIMEANLMLGSSMAGWTGEETFFNFWGNPREFLKKKSFTAKLKEKIAGRIIFNSYNYNQDIIAGWVKAIQKEKRVFLYGYTTVLTDIARFIEKQGISISSVQGVLTTAEKLYSWQRELMEKSFGARVFDQYGSREVPGMACECAHGNMHQLSHSSYLEFEDDPTVTNGSKKIIATCLTNFAMPFIRYEIGDYARPKEGDCPCGRGFPMMEMDIGRTADCFVTPEGNVVYGTFFVRQMYGQDRVQSFQFHQPTPDVVNLYVVRADGFTDDDASRLDSIRNTIHEHASTSMQLHIHFVDTIPRTQGGKHRFVVSDVVR